MCLECVVQPIINYLILNYLRQLPKTYIRPVLTSLLTTICIILSTWIIIIINFVNDRVTQKARPANVLPYIHTHTT